MRVRGVLPACLVLGLAGLIEADVPQRIHYQGKLVQGTNLFNGTTNLSFRLYDSEAGGSFPLFEDSGTVTVVDGLYAADIGDDPAGGSLAGALEAPEVWIEVVIGSQVLQPREQLTSSAFALRAAELDGGLPDDSSSNEVNTALSFDGTNLWITDSAGSLAADLGSLADSARINTASNALRTDVNANLAATGDNRAALNNASNSLQAGIDTHVAADLDISPLNEVNTSLVLNATTLELGDSAGLLTADLSSLQDGTGTDDQTLSLLGDTLEIEDGNSIDLSGYDESASVAAARAAGDAASNSVQSELLVHTSADKDLEPTNELVSSFIITNDTLFLVDAGGTQAVDLTQYQPGETDPVWTSNRNEGYTQYGLVNNLGELRLPYSSNLVFSSQGDNIIFGKDALAYSTSQGGIAIGKEATSRYRSGGVALGYRADGDYNGISIGYDSDGQYSNIAIGMYASAYSGYDRISIGYGITNRRNNTIAVRGTMYLDGGTAVLYRSTVGTGNWSVKAFTIDHPLDPENRLLRHYSLEGPEVWNVYAGNAILENGRAEITLPDYYTALNLQGSEVFQLTAIGGPASLWIAETPSQNRFIVAGTPDVKFSWTIKVLRNDPGCQESLRRLPLEETKTRE